MNVAEAPAKRKICTPKICVSNTTQNQREYSAFFFFLSIQISSLQSSMKLSDQYVGLEDFHVIRVAFVFIKKDQMISNG